MDEQERMEMEHLEESYVRGYLNENAKDKYIELLLKEAKE